MKTTLSSFVIATALSVFVGCKDQDVKIDVASSVKAESNTWVVTVGMDYSQFAGACPGAAYDAKRMTSLLSSYTPHVKAFSDESATKANVRAAMTEAAENADLFIFFYSGHGGQQRFWDTGSEEVDGKDEFLCLYDTYMRDNEVWNIFLKCKGRVLMINDCCHSATMFRNPSPISFRSFQSLRATHTESGPVNLLVWSGCPDDTYSYGSASGGQFTNTLLKYFDPRKTYDVLWTEIENDSNLKRFEQVQRTIIGSGFVAKPIFR